MIGGGASQHRRRGTQFPGPQIRCQHEEESSSAVFSPFERLESSVAHRPTPLSSHAKAMARVRRRDRVGVSSKGAGKPQETKQVRQFSKKKTRPQSRFRLLQGNQHDASDAGAKSQSPTNGGQSGRKSYATSNLDLRQQVIELQEQLQTLELNLSRNSYAKKEADSALKAANSRESELVSQVSSLSAELEHVRGKVLQQTLMVQKLEQQLIDTPLIPRTLDKLAISSEARNTKSWCSDSLTLLQTSQAAAELEMNSSCDVEKRGGKIDEQNIEGRLPLHERARLYRISLETQPGNKDPKIYHQHAHMIYGVDIG